MARKKKIDAQPDYSDELSEDEDYKAVMAELEAEKEGKGTNQLVIEELGQVAPAVPVRWVDVADDERPFRSPKEEFVRSPWPIDLTMLADRWSGLWKPWDIEKLYAEDNWARQRFLYQDAKDRQAFENSLATDANYQKRVLNQDIEQMYLVIERLMNDFLQGYEYKPVRNAGAFAYVKMPMTMESRAKLVRTIIEARKFRGVRVGLFSDLTGSHSKHEMTLTDQLRATRAEQDPEYRKLMEIAGIKVLMPSEIRSLPEGARIIDAEPKISVEKGAPNGIG